ncbi:hypothetical protein IFM89_032500 [Coptis chinensis]|uniref:Bifunctional inhibitor/plant lipid transfer protein/seed storage helical domain-containing protein n=1 Tax=Coptis chinensis TaxID=261450 RepID=A0A835MG81_9MAGN|nr:hypothetical protein IFM89_032500 [Coptis chinensis]
MASKLITFCLAIVLVTIFSSGAMAQSGCTIAMIGLSPCLNFVTGNSSSPSSTCCSQLASIVQSQPLCLCSVLNGGGGVLGLSINQTLALALPGACNVQTPPVSQCNAANGPATSPTASPVDVPTTSSPTASPVDVPANSPSDSSNVTPDFLPAPSANDIPAGGGSKTIPTTGRGTGDASDGNVTNIPLYLSVFLIFLVSRLSTLTSF